MKFVTASMLILAVVPLVVDAKRRRVPFMVCPSTKSNSGLVTVHSARSKIECSVICLNDPDCLSASYCKNPDGYTCQLSSFYAAGTCAGLLVDGDCTQTAMMYPCENGGTFFLETRTCHCVEGFVGEYCQRRYRDSVETPGGDLWYLTQPFGSDHVINWRCHEGTYTVTEFQFSITYNYTHTWQEVQVGLDYIPGFYAFIGLENRHQLTKQGRYDMYLSLFIIGKEKAVLWYRNVRVDTEGNGYALHWDHCDEDPSNINFLDGLGGAGDATKNLNGARFGTHDNDVNDCAKKKNIGWWYNPHGCMVMDVGPNGIYWPVNRNGTIQNEHMHFCKLGVKVVYFYEEDDLVL